MHPDRVLVAERLADRVDAGQRDLRGVERVDAQVRRAARVRGAADEARGLADPAVVRRGHAGLAVLRPPVGVDHHREVHVVEVAEAHQLLLAARELEAAAPGSAPAATRCRRPPRRARRRRPRGRRGARRRPRRPRPMAAPSIPATCALCPQACAAPVSGSASGCPVTRSPSSSPMSAKVGPSPPRAARLRAHAGHRETGPRGHAEAAEGLLDQPRGLHFLEAHLGLLPDPLAEADDLVGAAIDRREHLALQLVPGHGSRC